MQLVNPLSVQDLGPISCIMYTRPKRDTCVYFTLSVRSVSKKNVVNTPIVTIRIPVVTNKAPVVINGATIVTNNTIVTKSN